jgi:Saxitoxin biosynthesis operon protein SxtJ
MQERVDAKQLRSFGFLVGGIFAVIGLWPMLLGRGVRLWAIIPAVILIGLGALLPMSLRPIHKAWMRIGHVLGWINTRIILSVAFYGMFVPMGFIMRLAGKDPMRRKFAADADTYRIPSQPRPGSHMLRQF